MTPSEEAKELTDSKVMISKAERIIANIAPALGLSQIEVRKIIDGEDSWHVKDFVEATIVESEATLAEMKRRNEELAKRIEHECYWCEDCGKLVAKPDYGEHSGDHTIVKVTTIAGWGIRDFLLEESKTEKETTK